MKNLKDLSVGSRIARLPTDSEVHEVGVVLDVSEYVVWVEWPYRSVLAYDRDTGRRVDPETGERLDVDDRSQLVAVETLSIELRADALDAVELPCGTHECSICGYERDVRCRACAVSWTPARLAPEALAALVVATDLVESATEDRRTALERAYRRALDLTLEVGRALMSGAADADCVGPEVIRLGSALSQEINRRHERELAAVRGGEKTALKVALARYGGHEDNCPRRRCLEIDAESSAHCSCGWDEVFDALEGGR